jgi:F5/8 type C domain
MQLSGRAANEIDIVSRATISYSSEHPDHQVEHLLDGQSGPRATRWMSARTDTIEHLLVEFDQPQTISRLMFEVEETTRERTQEVRVEVSEDGARTYRQIQAAVPPELSPNFGDGLKDQAAAWACDRAEWPMTSNPSANFTPWISFGNWL